MGNIDAKVVARSKRDYHCHSLSASHIVLVLGVHMSDPNRQSSLNPLTDRELDILGLLGKGLSNQEIADQLVISLATVKWYNQQIYSKLGVRNRTKAVTRASELGLLERPEGEPPMADEATFPKRNLPAQLTSFVGRQREVSDVTELLRSSRLVTLQGPGGTGKTRLALQVVTDLIDTFVDGVYFVDLAPLSDPGLVGTTIADTLGLAVRTRGCAQGTLQAYLRERCLLLLLDNFEHLVQAAPLVADLLSAAPDVKVLVTSREVLRLHGETSYYVPP